MHTFFWRACKDLKYSPTVDLFATATHKHVERYHAPTVDSHAAGMDAFAVNWQLERRPYANAPWPVIDNVLGKLIADQVSAMVVVTSWPGAPWFEL